MGGVEVGMEDPIHTCHVEAVAGVEEEVGVEAEVEVEVEGARRRCQAKRGRLCRDLAGNDGRIECIESKEGSVLINNWIVVHKMDRSHPRLQP